MKKTFLSIALLGITAVFGQAYDGYADNKTSIGATFQSGATGIVASFDRGINDYISYGSSIGATIKSDTPIKSSSVDYLGNVVNNEYEKSDLFLERIDFNLRLNGHFGKLIGLGEMADIYGGGNISFRNIGAQVGVRYLISDGFGFFAEARIPVIKFTAMSSASGSNESKNILPYYEQAVFGIGILISN